MTNRQLEQRVAELEDENRQLRQTREPDGLFEKYRVIRKGIGGGRIVENPFVLVPEKDPHAVVALIAYAASVEGENPTLAKELREWMDGVNAVRNAGEGADTLD